MEEPLTKLLPSSFLVHLEADEPSPEFDEVCQEFFDYDKVVFPFVFDEEQRVFMLVFELTDEQVYANLYYREYDGDEEEEEEQSKPA